MRRDRKSSRFSVIATLGCVLVGVVASVQRGDASPAVSCGFKDGFAWHMGGEIHAFSVFNDGTGDALYVVVNGRLRVSLRRMG